MIWHSAPHWALRCHAILETRVSIHKKLTFLKRGNKQKFLIWIFTSIKKRLEMSTKAKQKQWFLQKTFMPIFLTVHYVTMYITGFGWSTSDLLLPTCVGKETEAAITPKVPPNQLPTTTISVSTIQRPLISYSRLCQRQTALHFITQKNASVPVVHKQTQTLIL